MQFITIDGKPPVNLDMVKGFSANNHSKRGNKTIYFSGNDGSSYWCWEFESKKDRDKAYHFLVRKTCIQYKSRDKIAEAIRKTKKAALDRFVDIVKRRRKPFGTPILGGKEVGLIEYNKHQIKKQESRVKSMATRSPKNWLKKVTSLGIEV